MHRSDMVDQYLSIGEAAKRLGVSIDTVRRWEKSGKLRAYRLDGKNRSFIVRDIDSLRLGPSISIKKAANYLQVSTSTVRRRAIHGQLPATIQENRFRKFSFEDLEKYKSSQPVVLKPPPSESVVHIHKTSVTKTPSTRIGALLFAGVSAVAGLVYFLFNSLQLKQLLYIFFSNLHVPLKLRGMSQSVMQRLEDGKWQSALVMGELIRHYWKQTRGTEWMASEDPLPQVERIQQAGLF